MIKYKLLINLNLSCESDLQIGPKNKNALNIEISGVSNKTIDLIFTGVFLSCFLLFSVKIFFRPLIERNDSNAFELIPWILNEMN